MLAKSSRLNRVEINLLRDPGRKGKIIQGSFFGLIFKESSQSGKFGVIISNKISPKAVERNRIKRLLYRTVEDEMADETGLFLFLAKRNCVNAGLEEFEKEVKFFQDNIIG